MTVSPKYVEEITDQLKNFTHQVTMTTSYSGDWYPWEWLFHQCELKRKESSEEARSYCLALLQVIQRENASAVKDNGIRFLQECLEVDFSLELLSFIEANSDELYGIPTEIQGMLGKSLLSAAYIALIRNRAFQKVARKLDYDRLKFLLIEGQSPELVYVLTNHDSEWMKKQVDQFMSLYPEWANEIFGIMVGEMQIEPLEAAHKILAVHKEDARRLEDAWKRIESFASTENGKKADKRFLDFVSEHRGEQSKPILDTPVSADALNRQIAAVDGLKALLFGSSFSGYLEGVQAFGYQANAEELGPPLLDRELVGRLCSVLRIEQWADHADYLDKLAEFIETLPRFKELFSDEGMAPHLKGIALFIDGLVNKKYDVSGFQYVSTSGFLVSRIAADKISEYLSEKGRSEDAATFMKISAWFQLISTAQFSAVHAVSNIIKEWDEPMLQGLYETLVACDPYFQGWVLRALAPSSEVPLVKALLFDKFPAELAQA